jgi:acyl-CoA thioesterase-1
MLRSIVVLLFFLPAVCHAATVLVFGDSLSAGFGLRIEEAWPSLLQKRIAGEGFKQTVVNASVSGETTAGGRTRLPAALAQHKPVAVVIELGANDGLRGLPIAAMRDNLDAMTRMATEAGAKVVIVGMQLPPNYGPDYTKKFADSFPEVASKNKAALVPFLLEGFADRSNWFQADGLHPVAAAQPTIVETIWKGLKPVLKR